MAQSLCALEREYDALVAALPEEDASVAKADRYLATTHAAHRSGSLPWSATPRILSAGQAQVLSAAAETCGSIMDKVAKLYLKDPSFRARFGFAPEVEELTLVPTGYEAQVPLARVDVDFCGRTGALQVRGVSVDGFTGMTSTVEVTRAEQMTYAYRAFAEKHPGIAAFDSVDAPALVAGAVSPVGADDRLGERGGGVYLSGAGSPDEEIRVGKPPLGQGLRQEIVDARLVRHGGEDAGGLHHAPTASGARSPGTRSASSETRRASTSSTEPAASTTRTRAGSSDARRR